MSNLYYFNSWEDVFLSSVRTLKGTLILVSPYMRFNIIKKMIAALPKDEPIKLIILTKFSKKSFQQKKSDLNLFDFLINYKTDNLECQCYDFKHLDSNIYMFNNEHMYIGSSNLSKQSLIKNHSVSIRIDNIDEIKTVGNEIIALIKDSNRISNDDVINMRKYVKDESYNSFKNGISQSTEEDKDPIFISDIIEKNVTSTIEENTLNLADQLSYNQVIDNYNVYKNREGLSTLNNKDFITLGIYLNPENITPEIEREAFDDFNKLYAHIVQTFSEVVPIKDNSIFRDDIINCFIHPTWQHKFKKFNTSFSISRKDLFSRLGKSSFSSFIAISITKSRLFQQGRNELFNNTYIYMKSTYPYLEALEAIECNIYLSSHSVMKNNIQNIFFELLGVLCWHLEFKKFNEIFNDYFDYTNEYVYDEYKSFDNKTLLQELSQQKYGLPKYIQISENGPDHKKIFEFNVEINSEVLGRGTGDSKKNAQEKAAENAVYNFIKKYSYIEKKVIKDYKLQPYDLTEKRKNQLKELNILLPKQISNLYMLDIAFSHISIINLEPFSRSNDSLSFLGSFIENLSRTIAMLHSLKDFEDKSFNKYIAMLNKAHVGVILENYFDTMNFQYFLKSNLPNKTIPTSVKLSCVESLLALYFLEYGLEFTESYIREIWKDFKTDDLYVDYTNLLQEYIQNPKIGLSSNSIVYNVLNESGKDHNKTFEIGCYIENILYGIGIATSKKEAKRIASHETYKNSNFVEKYPLNMLKK